MTITGKVILIVSASLLFGFAWISAIPHPAAARFVVPEVEDSTSNKPFYREALASRGLTREVHSATAYTHNNKVTALWYGGSQEGAGDVCIYAATYRNGDWGEPRLIMDQRRAQQQLGRFVRKVGNPVVFNHGDGRLWLFFVSVAVGGWAGSSINLMESVDNGPTWSAPKRLVTSPFLNLSTLVKNPAFKYTDGTIGLPVYHELIGKFGELLRLDPASGRILDKTRLSSGSTSLQPAITPVSPTEALGFMRYGGEDGKVLFVETDDGGHTWTDPHKLELPNPNSPVTTLRTDDYTLLILNNRPEGRQDLSLAVSRDGNDWRIVHELEYADVHPASHDFEYSYPWLMRSQDGRYHLLYTWNKKFIKHVSFNDAWLEEKIK